MKTNELKNLLSQHGISIRGVSPEFLASMESAGIDDLSVNALQIRRMAREFGLDTAVANTAHLIARDIDRKGQYTDVVVLDGKTMALSISTGGLTITPVTGVNYGEAF